MDRKLALIVQFAAADKLSGALRNIVGLGESGSAALGRMKREARDLDGQLRTAQRGLSGATGNVTELVNRERELEAAIAAANARMERQTRLIQINAAVSKMQARGDALKAAGQKNMMEGAALSAPFILAGKAAMDFSSGMVDVQQKAELTDAETDKMANTLIALAAKFHQLPTDMRAGVDTLAGLGLDPREAIQMIGPIGKLGTAFKVDLADGANAAFSNLNSLKIPIEQTAAAFDIMAASGNAGAFEMKDMARWFPTLTTQMQAMGQTGLGAVTDLSAALQIVRRGAGTSDQAATNLNDLLTKINAKVTVNAFKKQFGVDLPNAIKKGVAAGKTPLEAIVELTQQVTGGDLTKIGKVFSNQEASSALRTLMLNYNDYLSMRAEVAQAAGTVDASFEQRELRDASLAWKDFQVQLQSTALIIGAKLLPAARQFLGQINSIVGQVGAWAQANPKAASTLVSLAGGLVLAKISVGMLQFAFGSLLGPMATAWGLYQKWRLAGSIVEGFPAAAKAFGMLRAAAIFLGQGMMRAGAMMLANPIVLTITAVVAAVWAVYEVWKHWDQIVPIVVNAWTKVTDFIGSIDWAGIGKAVVQGVFFGLGLAWGGLKAWFTLVWIDLPKLVMSIDWLGLGGKVVGAVSAGLVAGWNALTVWVTGTAGPALMEAIKGLSWKDVGMFIADMLTFGLASRLPTILNGLQTAFSEAAPAASKGFAQGQSVAGARAGGGPVRAGQTYLVGEEGVELFRPRTSGDIVPNHALRGSNDNEVNGGVTYAISVTVNGGAAQDIASAIRLEIERLERERRGRSFGDD